MDKIERVDAVTLERRVLSRATTPQHPFDLAVRGRFLFYSDWVLHAVLRVDKRTGEEVAWLRKNIPRPMSIIAVGEPEFECPRYVNVLLGPCACDVRIRPLRGASEYEGMTNEMGKSPRMRMLDVNAPI